MKKANPFELSHKKYCTDYREIKKIWTSAEFQLLMLRNLSSKKRNIGIKRYLGTQTELGNYLKDIKSLTSLGEIKGINKFIGYTMHTDGNKRRQLKSWLMFIFEFGETDLLEFARKHYLSLQRRQDLLFLQHLPTRIVQLYCSLQTYPGIDLSNLLVDHDLIILDNYKQPHQALKLCYFPFPFFKQHHLMHHNFNTHVYSSRQLRVFNRQRQEKPELPPHLKVSDIILESERETDNSSCNLQTLHKIGLSLLKFIYILCRDISISQPHFQLYCMNEQFDIDFNWNHIESLLGELQKQKEYRQVAKQLKYMVRECQEQKSFAQYLQDIKLMRNSQHKKKERLEQQFKTAEKDKYISHHSRIYSFEDKSAQRIDKSPTQLQKIQEIEAKLITKQTEVIHYEDGSTYRGQIINGQRHGLGIYTFAEGDIFGGQWQNNSMSGQGFYYFTNKERYEGQILAGVKHGYGTYYYKNGDYYCGLWKNDVKQGKGQFFSSETYELYKGQFKDNLKTNFGIIFYANNQRFEGFFSHGMKNGEGCVYDSNGKIYLKSNWKNDIIEGIVQQFMPNNDYFIGLMSQNKKNGKGMYKYNNGTIYEGQFIDDKQEGECTIEFANGDRYEGRVKDGRFQGFGKYYYRTADMVYQGQWKDGKENGKGVYRYRGTLELESDVKNGDLIRYTPNRSSENI